MSGTIYCSLWAYKRKKNNKLLNKIYAYWTLIHDIKVKKWGGVIEQLELGRRGLGRATLGRTVKEVVPRLRPDASQEWTMRRAAEEQEQRPNEQGGGEAGEVGREQIG